MHATLLVPGPLARISGGYNYDRRMLAEWRRAGHHVAAVELTGTHPRADAAARAAAAAALAACAGAPVIDSLGLPAFADVADGLGARGAVGLIHHPVSMETGLDEAVRAELQAIEARLLPALARVVTTSESTAATLVAQFGVAAELITTITPGTDPAPLSLGSGRETCEILSVGALIPRKGYVTLLRALAKLFDLDWHLTIAGPSPDPVHAQSLRVLVDELGIAQRVTFAGEVADAEPLWQAADLFALATQYEGYGMAIAEALARGLPCAIGNGGGAAGKLVPMEAGAVVEPGDVITLSKSLRRMIFDTPLRADMAVAARAAGAALPSWAAQAAAFAAVL